MTIITMKMNVIDSIESNDTMTFINNEQSITVNILSLCIFLNFSHIVLILILKTLDYMENKLQCPQQLLLNKK